MARRTDGRGRRQAGQIEMLPSGALRVRVYAGIDPVTRKRHYLNETVPSGPGAEREAKKVLARLVADVYDRRHPRTSATVEQLVDRYLDELRLERKTLTAYRGYLLRHVLPFIGRLKVGAVDADVLDSLYAELLRCRNHCDAKVRTVDHRTLRPHECDHRCRPHECRPLAAGTVRKIHWILSGAFRRAQRWRWITSNPMELAEPPAVTPANPKPPTPEQAAQLINDAWDDPDWGMLVWLTMVTGLRRGELCALRWRHIDLDTGTLRVEGRIGQIGSEIWETESTKTHADRRVVLDGETVELLREHGQRRSATCDALGLELGEDAFVFSLDPDGKRPRPPDSVTQRYARMCRRLGIPSSIHKLRHFTATELIAGGVDIRTVAGRLGHSGGGATTLRTYAAWVSEADQRAAGEIASRMPSRPTIAASLPPRVEVDPKHAYERIAVELSERIYAGKIPVGLAIPTIKDLARDYGVSTSTAQRAVKLLEEWGLVRVATGRPTLVLLRPSAAEAPPRAQPTSHLGSGREPLDQAQRALDLEVRHLGQVVANFRAHADPSDIAVLHRLLLGAVRRNSDPPEAVEDYELVVRESDASDVITTYVAVAP
jgi:integrase